MNEKTLPASAGQVERPVRPAAPTEWREIADALKREYGEQRERYGVPYWSFDNHCYVGRAGALLLKAERQEAALREAIATLERDGDEWGVCARLRLVLKA